MKKFLGLLVVILLALTIFPLYGMSATPKYGGIIRTAVMSDPPTLDPAHITDTTSDMVARQIFDGLVDYDENLKIVPVIAKNWTISKDGKVYTFNLRQGVKFHNGREVTAEDFKYSWERVMNPATKSERANFMEDIAKVEAPSKYVFKVTLKEPRGYFLQMLPYSCFWVVPKEEVEKSGADFGNKPVGSGPFKFVSWTHDDKVVLEANKDYFAGRPYADGVEIRIIPDETVIIMELEKGNLEWYENIPPSEFTRLSEDPKWKDNIISKPELGTYYIGMNCQKPPLNNKLVRQAINYAINREQIIKTIMRGMVQPATGILPPGIPGYSKRAPIPYDPERAKRLLKQAGYPDGKGLPTLELAFNKNATHQRIVEAIQADLKKVGINVEPMQMDWAQYLEKVDRGETQLFRLGWIADYPDADNFLWVLFNSKNWGPPGNGAYYKNAKVDELTDRAKTMVQSAARNSLYKQAESIILEDAPWAPIYFYTSWAIKQPYVEGFTFSGMGPFTVALEKVWLNK